MRVGQNPNRNATVAGYASVIVSAITHLPTMTGYHERRFEVIRASLESMRRNAGQSAQVMIWDNGSCGDFLRWLIGEYRPDYLMISPNIGKASARAGIIRALPPLTVVGVADDDIYYYPGWLTAQIELLYGFPNVGQVSGCPIRTQARWGNTKTLQWAQESARLEWGKHIPDDYERDFCTGIGRDYEWHRKYTEKDLDPLITYNGMRAYGTAHHCQFIGYAGKLAPVVRWDIEAMGDEKPFDNAVDAAGLLRLTTTRRYTRHMGNVIDKDIAEMEAVHA